MAPWTLLSWTYEAITSSGVCNFCALFEYLCLNHHDKMGAYRWYVDPEWSMMSKPCNFRLSSSVLAQQPPVRSGALADTSRVSHTCLFKILPELYPICVSKAYMKCRWFWSFNLKPIPKISQSIAANSYVKSDPKPFWSQIFPPLAPSLSSKWDSLTEQIMITSHGSEI